MASRSNPPAFLRWATRLLEHPLGAEIYELAQNMPEARTPPAIRVTRLTWLLRNAELFVKQPPAQIGQAVWFLASEGDGELRVLHDDSVESQAREDAAEAISSLFERLLARVCTATLGHTAEGGEGPAGWANMACYMFWDTCPIGPRSDESRFARLDAACLRAMERTLAIPHVACQEAALHGLGHWHHAYRPRVQAIIDVFLERSPNAPEELLSYARQARAGHVA